MRSVRGDPFEFEILYRRKLVLPLHRIQLLDNIYVKIRLPVPVVVMLTSSWRRIPDVKDASFFGRHVNALPHASPVHVKEVFF